MKLDGRFGILAAAVLCSACTVNPDPETRLHAELKPFVGQRLTAYLQATGDAPISAYNTADGHRHFVFQRSVLATAPTVALPGFYVPSAQGTVSCSRTVETRYDGSGDTPDAYRIVSITTPGNC